MVHRLFFVFAVCLATIALPLHAKVVRRVRQTDAEKQGTRELMSSQRRYLTCSYAGDPHLIPFYQPYIQYWCQRHGWELLISNKYFTIYTFAASSSNYAIHDYKLVFADSSCSMGGPSNSVPCSSSSLVISFVTPSTSYYFHTGGEFLIKIDRGAAHYDFYIWQSPKLVKESCGVCVSWNCPQEPRWLQANPVVPKICDVFASAAQTHATGAIDPRIIDVAVTSCINDIQTTFDVRAAQTAFTLVMQDGIKDILGGGAEDQKVFERLEEITKEARRDAEAKANEIIAGSEPVCNEEKKCLRSFGREDEDSKQ